MLSHQPIESRGGLPPAGPLRRIWHWLRPPTQAHRDRQTRAQRMAARTVLVGFCAGLVMVVVWQAKPMHRLLQSWRADRLCQRAEVHLEEGQVMMALQLAQEAVRLSPEHLKAARINAEILSRGRRPEAMYFFDLLERLGAMRDEDRVMRVRALAGMRRMDEAGRLLDELFRRQQPGEEMMELAMLVWPGDMAKVAEKLEQHAKAHPEDHKHALRLAGAQMGSGQPTLIERGTKLAWDLSQRAPAEWSLKALELLDSRVDLPASQAQQLIKALRAHPKADARHWAASLRREVRLEPLRQQEIVSAAVSRIRREGCKGNEALVHWLMEPPLSQYSLALSLMSEQESWSNRLLLECRLTALTALSRFEELEKCVEDKRGDQWLSPASKAFYRAHLAFVTGKPFEQTAQLLDLAVKLGRNENRADLLLRLAGYAEARGHQDVAREVFSVLSRVAEMQKVGYDGWLRLLMAQGRLDELVEVGARARQLYPQETQYLRLLAYVNLLLGRDVEVALMTARQQAGQAKNDQDWRLLELMGLWRMKDQQSAQSLLKDLDPLQLAKSAGQRAVLACVARDCGDEQALEKLLSELSKIDLGAAMLPQERECLQRLALR